MSGAMKKSFLKVNLAVAGLLVFSGSLFASAAATQAVPQLFTVEPDKAGTTLQRQATDYLAQLHSDPANAEITLVKLDPTLTDADTRTLAVSLPDGKTARFDLRDFTTLAPGIDAWVGYKASAWKQTGSTSAAEIGHDPLYYLSLAREGDKVVGDVVIDGQPYRIEPVGAGQHALIKRDQAQLPPEAEPLVAPETDLANDRVSVIAPSTHSTIRVLFLTTNQRRERSPNYKVELAQALNNANQYMKNSDVQITYQLAGFYDGDYDETDRTYNQQLGDIRTAKPFSDEVLRVREHLRADMVSMYSTASAYCGMAWLNANQSNTHSVISCLGSLGHELGHNLGAMHGWPEDGNRQPPYMFGYRYTEGTPRFSTQMSYGCSPACPRIPYHSNPRLTYQGIPLGTAQNHDAARRFNERRTIIEHFYPPAPLQVTVFDDAGMQGNSCAFEIPPGQAITSIEQACGASWKYKVWSARVNHIVPGTQMQLGNAFAWHTYKSETYGGDFDIPNFSRAAQEVPEGMLHEPHPNDLNRKIEHVRTYGN